MRRVGVSLIGGLGGDGGEVRGRRGVDMGVIGC